MEQQPLVSIITPCYNGEDFLKRFFQSILSQTYRNLELIFINDGSTDRTEEIALSYQPALEQRGVSFSLINQKNMGPPGAINAGLERFHGVYLTWPDSDDWMLPDCIEKKVRYLESHPDKDLVQCRCLMVREENPKRVVGVLGRRRTYNGRLFDDLILEHDVVFAPISWMIRADCFLHTVPSRHIYDENRAGQAWQLLLPVCYEGECGFLPDYLAYYLIRNNSHSRTEKDYRSKLEKTFRHREILEHVISDMNMEESKQKQYFEMIQHKFFRQRMLIAAEYRNKADFQKNVSLLGERKMWFKEDWLCYLRCICKPFDFAYRGANYLQRRFFFV